MINELYLASIISTIYLLCFNPKVAIIVIKSCFLVFIFSFGALIWDKATLLKHNFNTNLGRTGAVGLHGEEKESFFLGLENLYAEDFDNEKCREKTFILAKGLNLNSFLAQSLNFRQFLNKSW